MRVVKSVSTSKEVASQLEAMASRAGVSFSSIVNQAIREHLERQNQRSAWTTDDSNGWYDPKKFYTYTEDKHGHSAQIRMWVPKNLAGQIGRIVSSGEIAELKTTSAFYRDALFHRAHQIGQWLNDGELLAEVDLQLMLAEEARIQQTKQDMGLLMEAITENAEEAIRREDWKWLESYLNKRLENAELIPLEYRREYLDLVKTYRVKVVKGKKAAS